MEWVETTGKTVSEAKDAALDQLGVDERDAEFEVINEERTGLFGRLKEEARVRARVRPTAPRAKEPNNRRRNGRGRKERGPREASVRTSGSSTHTDDDSAEGSEEESESPRSSSSRSRSRSRTRKPRVESTDEGTSEMSDPEVSLDQQGEVAEEFLVGLFQETNLPVQIEKSTIEEDDIVSITVEGDNLGHFIGPRGTTLHSLQELTRTVVQRKTGSRSARVVLDISGYRVKRRAALEQFTQQVAETVKSSGEAQALEPMNPADRKVVHDTANDIDGVSTSSEGEEPRRWVVISPAS